MKIYFTTNQKWYSRLMRWLWSDEVTHVGIGFNEFQHELVFDISKPYGSIYPVELWFKKYEKRYELSFDLTEREINKYFADLWYYCILKEYDIGTYYYAIYWGILKKFFKVPLPKSNIIANENKGICSNVIDPIKDLLSKNGYCFQNVDTYSKTPQMLLNEFKKYPYIQKSK